MKSVSAFLILLSAAGSVASVLPPVNTVFVILLENHNWSSIQGSPDAPYLNATLLPMASYCQQYYNPPGLHPSEPNYLWLEAGTNFGIFNDLDPSANHQPMTAHLVTQLRQAGIAWKTYQEDISGTFVPLTSTNYYTPRHNPFVYFDDVTGTNDWNNAYGIAHIRPYGELEADLTNNTVARYNFITPNLCDDAHDSCAPLYNPVRQSDDWLASEVPKILGSPVFANGAVLFITWDEGSSGDGPIGMLVLSPLARGGGYFNNLHYTHGSLLRTLQEFFGVSPWLGDAANATDLGDLFTRFGFSSVVAQPGGDMQLTAVGVIPGRTNSVQASTDLTNWIPISTNWSSSNTFTMSDTFATNFSARFYRLVQLP
jgi:hypothetical protein